MMRLTFGFLVAQKRIPRDKLWSKGQKKISKKRS